MLQHAISILHENHHPLAANADSPHFASISQKLLDLCSNINQVPIFLLDSNNLLSGAITTSFFQLHEQFPSGVPFIIPQPLHAIYQTILPHILLTKISTYISTSITNSTPLSIIELLEILYPISPMLGFPMLKLDPFLVVTNKAWESLLKFHTFQNTNPNISTTLQMCFDHVTTLQATKVIEHSWHSFTDQRLVLAPETFASLCMQSFTTLEKWAISCNFFNFYTNQNLTPYSTPPCCPQWPTLFKTLLQIPNSSVGLHAIQTGDNDIAWMVFISRLSLLFPKGYFNWQTHPLLAQANTLKRKANIVHSHIMQLAESCRISQKGLLLNHHLIPHDMQWSTKEGTLWSHIVLNFINLQKEIRNSQIKAGKILRSNLFSKLAYIKFYKKNKTSNTFTYTCRHCKSTLLTLDALSKTLCMECEVLSCQFCYKLQFTPFNKYCTECTNMIAALDDPEFDVPVPASISGESQTPTP